MCELYSDTDSYNNKDKRQFLLILVIDVVVKLSFSKFFWHNSPD